MSDTWVASGAPPQPWSSYPPPADMESNASPVSVLVTDLDNTVWDWFEMWHAGFAALLERLVAISGVDQGILEAEIRVHHQKNGTSEYSPKLLIPLVPSLQDGSDRDALLARYDDAIHAYYSARKRSLRLYPGVLDTLLAARKAGTIIVGYTESQAFVTAQRILRTDLDGVFDYLYSPPDHELPHGVSLEDLRQYDPSHYELRLTRHFHTPSGVKKPNAEVLKSILAEVNAAPASTVYVGDSRMKDIAMAQAVDLRDVWAQYGEVQQHPGYELLRRVSHWPDDDVEEEKRIAAENSITPTYVLTDRFDELQEQFTFSPRRPLTGDELDRSLDVWQQTVQVQEHFNDLEMRIRNFGLTLLVAVIGVTGIVLQNGNKVLASLLMGGGLVAWIAFYMMDQWWYHPLLRGAVAHAIRLENQLAPQVLGIGLTGTIREASHTVMLGQERDSAWKMRWFYRLIAALLLLILLAIPFTRFGEASDTGTPPSPSPATSPTSG